MKSRSVSGFIMGVPACCTKAWFMGDKAAGDGAKERISTSATCEASFSCITDRLFGWPRAKGSSCFAAFFLRQQNRRAARASKKASEAPTATPITTPLDVDFVCECCEAADVEDEFEVADVVEA